MEWDDDERGELVESERADVVVHVVGRGDGGEDVDVGGAVVFPLEVAEGEDDVLRVGVVGDGFLLQLVGDEHRRGTPDELDEVEDVDGDRILLGRARDVEEVDNGEGVVRPVDARHDAELGVVGCRLHDVSLLIAGVFPHGVVQVSHRKWHYYCSYKNGGHHKAVDLQIYNLHDVIVKI